MAVVKGSKQEKMIVVPYRPWRTIAVQLGVAVCVLMTGAGFYLYGYNIGIDENNDARLERDRLIVEVENYSNEVTVLLQEMVNSEQGREVSRQALLEVQETIFSLTEKNTQLEEDVLFYKQIMSPENNEIGLAIGQLDLLIGGDEGAVRYRIELKQLADNDEFVTGYANVNVLGMQNGQEISIPLRSLSASEEQLDIRFRFRYFQNIEGELFLPENFLAEKIQIIAVSEGNNARTVQKSFSWLVER